MTFATLLLALIALPAGTERPGEPILLDFTATWCGPCQSMRPAVEKLLEKGYPVKAVDIDKAPDLAERYHVNQVPTFIVIDPGDGHELARTTGALPALDLAILYRDAKTRFLATRAPADEDRSAEAGDDNDEQHPEPKPTKPNPDPWETAVRIKVHGHGSIGSGSGTVIASTPKETLILTCAHIFHMDVRKQAAPSQFPLRISVDLFDGHLVGDRPSQVHYANETYEGQAVDYDFDRDVGLIRIRPGKVLPCAKVVPAYWSPKAGNGMITVGCSEGHDASAWRTTIVNPSMRGLQGKVAYEAIECMIAPKEGRSGGGLFTADGYVAGVCDFAEPRGKVGLYAAPHSIYAILDRNRLTALYDPSKAPERLLADRGNTGARSIPVKQRLQSPEPEAPPVSLPEPELLGIKVPKVAPATLAENPPERHAATANRQSWHPGNAIPTGQRLDPSLDPNRFDRNEIAPAPTGPDARSHETSDPSMPAPAQSSSTTRKWHAGRTPLPGLGGSSIN